MTTCLLQTDGTIELYFYGELEPEVRATVDDHLRTCPACRDALEDLGVIRAALGARADVAAPAGGDWAPFMARLEESLDGLRAGTAPAGRGPGVRTPGRPALPRLAPYFALAALLALVTFSVVVMREPTTPTVSQPTASQPTAGEETLPSSMPPAPDPGLLAVSDQHFERSKLVLLGLATRDVDEADDAAWQYERDLATTLLDDTRLYRRAAEERGMTTLAGVMHDLEVVLLQTSMTEAPDARTLEQLQQLIRRRDLLTKMTLVNASGL